MESKVSGQYTVVLSTSLAVLFIDVLLFNYFIVTGIYSSSTFIPMDIILMVSAILLGSRNVRELGFPVWQPKYEDEGSKKRLLISILIGSCIVIANTLVLLSSDVSNVPWLRFSSFFQPFLVSLRAASTEELLYRFCIFSVASRITGSIVKSRTIGIAAGAILSSILFGLQHPGFYFSFVIGAGLCCIYKNNGLIFAMLVHFLADFIPFTMIFLR